MNFRFWYHSDKLIEGSTVEIDHAKGSAHVNGGTYPLDFGHLKANLGFDGGVTCWIGSLPEKRVVGVIMTVDTERQKSAVKLLLGCSAEEGEAVLAFEQSGGNQGAQLVWR